jgi:hypothetical protein
MQDSEGLILSDQQKAFRETIGVFEREGLLPYVMLIGSWAGYVYHHYYKTDNAPSLRTRDVDFLYPNLKRPDSGAIRIVESMREIGFIYTVDRLTGVGRFVKEDLLELEFITRALGRGQPVNEIPSLKIKAEGLREVNILANHPFQISFSGVMITVPELEAYILQKLLINPTRSPEHKKEKDVQTVRELIGYVDGERMRQIFQKMSGKEQRTVTETSKKHFIELPQT